MSIGNIRRRVAPFLVAAFLAPASAIPALAQDAMQSCIQQGFKPGSSGFYRCLQKSGGSAQSETTQKSESGETGSKRNGSSDNTVPDFSGSTMDGASSPDPDILKQLNSGASPSR